MGCSSSSASGWTAADCSGSSGCAWTSGSGCSGCGSTAATGSWGSCSASGWTGAAAGCTSTSGTGARSGSSTDTRTFAGISFKPRKPVFWGISSTSKLTFSASASTPSWAQAFARASSTVLPVASRVRIIGLSPPFSVPARTAERCARPCTAQHPAGGHTPDGACSSRWQRSVFPQLCRSFRP